jgi:hypothetical protein
MNKNASRTKKWARFIVGTSAALAVPPQALAAEQSARSTSNVEALSEENAQLRKQLAEMQKKLDQLTGEGGKAAAKAAPAKATGNPFAMKELESGYGNVSTTAQAQSGASKTPAEKKASEMACGANMMKGGEMACGAKMMKGGEMACGANMVDMGAMEKGSQMQMNPVLSGMDFYHIHPKGMWMFNTKYMRVNQSGLMSGSSNVPLNQVLPDRFGAPNSTPPYNYMMAPTYMNMDMFMLMPMVGITDRLTVMAMANYMTMEMGMKMGMGNQTEADWETMAPMRTNGFSDTEFDAVYAITKEVFGTLGLTAPTGSINQQVEMMGTTYRAPYDMQNGTGTVALKPAISYHHVTDDALWMWGGQATFTGQLGRNEEGYTRGNNFKLTTFLQRAFGPATGFLHMTFNDTGKIRGFDPQIAKINLPMFDGGASMPDADPNNYGGQRLDLQIGFAYEKGPFSFGVEGGVPVYQYLNGLQLETTWMLNSGFQAMF